MIHSDNLHNAFQQNPNSAYGGGWNGNPGQAWSQAWGTGMQAFAQPQHGWGNGLGQPAFGYGPNFGGGQGWNQNFGGQFGGQWPQRQLSHQDVGEVVRQLLPILPQVIAQAQQPQAAFGQGGYGSGFGAAYGPAARNLSQQDVNEVVRQILPVLPQIVGLLQGSQQHGGYANAAYGGGLGSNNQGWNNQGLNNQGWHNPGQYNQGAYGYGNQNPYQLSLFGQNQPNAFGPFGQAAFGGNQSQAAFGGNQGNQRQLNQVEVGEIVRQLTAALPQVIANLQAINQQPNMQQRAA
ncbi:hypothetical protein [Hyphomicrobium sp.]|jgi:hypothetical protein|uniref:hypothetical protein n=1 Tax=Hyphomicrobium sp. TaxID=82 RepID=UPI003569AC55